MTYASWEPRHRVMTVSPGKLDLFVFTFIDGRRGAVQSITEYDDALAKARAFHRDHPCQIKVLPVTGIEARNLLGIEPGGDPEPGDANLRREIIDRLMHITCESADPDARRDALDELVSMGVIQR